MQRAFRIDGAALKRVYRRDTPQPISKTSRNAAGFLVVPASIAKTGPLEYTEPNGDKRIELVIADELFSANSMETFEDAPVVHRHPGEKVVTADNAKRLTVGWPKKVTRNADGEHVDAVLTITDAEAIKAIDAGEREISPGYFCDLEPIPGGQYTMPDGSQIRADFVQRNRTHNHIAIEPIGRSGPTVSMRLDAAGDVAPVTVIPVLPLPPSPGAPVTMEKIIIAGVEFEVPAAVAAEFRRIMAKMAEMDAARAAAPPPPAAPPPAPRADAADLARVTGERDALKTQLDAAKVKLDAIDQAEKTKAHRSLCERVAAAIEQDVETLVKLDSMSVKKMAIEKLAPSIKLDGKSDGYVDGILDTLMTNADGAGAGLRAIHDIKSLQRVDADDPRAKSEADFFGGFAKRIA